MIYFIDREPNLAASNLCDSHLREAVEYMKQVAREGPENRSDETDLHTAWVHRSSRHLKWVLDYGIAATMEIYMRKKRNPKYLIGLYEFTHLRDRLVKLNPEPRSGIVFPDDIDKVREWYRSEIAPTKKWTHRSRPSWMGRTKIPELPLVKTKVSRLYW